MRLGQHVETGFNACGHMIGDCGVKTESIPLHWPRAHAPELDNVLRDNAGSIAALV
jgi:hypothetical protein